MIIIGLHRDGGIEGVIDHIDRENLFSDHFYPIQLTVPELKNLMWRAPLRELRRKE